MESSVIGGMRSFFQNDLVPPITILLCSLGRRLGRQLSTLFYSSVCFIFFFVVLRGPPWLNGYSEASGPGSSPAQEHYIVFLGETLHSHIH